MLIPCIALIPDTLATLWAHWASTRWLGKGADIIVYHFVHLSLKESFLVDTLVSVHIEQKYLHSLHIHILFIYLGLRLPCHWTISSKSLIIHPNHWKLFMNKYRFIDLVISHSRHGEHPNTLLKVLSARRVFFEPLSFTKAPVWACNAAAVHLQVVWAFCADLSIIQVWVFFFSYLVVRNTSGCHRHGLRVMNQCKKSWCQGNLSHLLIQLVPSRPFWT